MCKLACLFLIVTIISGAYAHGEPGAQPGPCFGLPFLAPPSPPRLGYPKNLCLADSVPTRTSAKESGTDNPHASQIQYIQVNKIAIPKTREMPQEWYAIAYEADPKQFENWDQNEWPAKLCFMEESGRMGQQCFEAVEKGQRTLPNFQWVQKLSVVPVFKNKSIQEGVLFVAMCSYGGSGASSLVTLWTFEGKTKEFVNILPEITISNHGAYKILEGREDALDGTVVTADLAEHAKPSASPQRYRINIYRYDQADKRFKSIGGYSTKMEYGTQEAISVINEEIEIILGYVQERN